MGFFEKITAKMSKEAVTKLTYTWEKKDYPLSVTSSLLEEDRIIYGILLDNNKVDGVRKKHLRRKNR